MLKTCKHKICWKPSYHQIKMSHFLLFFFLLQFIVPCRTGRHRHGAPPPCRRSSVSGKVKALRRKAPKPNSPQENKEPWHFPTAWSLCLAEARKKLQENKKKKGENKMKQTAKRHFNTPVRSNRKPAGAGNYFTKFLNDAATEFLRENGYDHNGNPIDKLNTVNKYYK